MIVVQNLKTIMQRLYLSLIHISYIFELLKKWGNLDLKEMYSTFNMGLGMVFVVKESDRDKVLDHFKDYDSIYEIGKVVDGNEIELKY